MTDPLEFDEKFESLFCLEILSYLTLAMVQETALGVSTVWKRACDNHKSLVVQSLQTKNKQVMLWGLTSTKGKTLNGTLVKVTGPPNEQNRYPVQFENWLTGEAEQLTIKLGNLFLFYTTSSAQDSDIHNLKDYSSTAKLPRNHGMMIDQLLKLARWEGNSILGHKFEGTFQQFVSLPNTHPIISETNAQLWTWWTVHPKLAGIHHESGTICDVVTSAFMDNYNVLSKMALESRIMPELDGPSGMDMPKNMVRFARSWPDQRIPGSFWVVKKVPTGSILVEVEEGKDPYTDFGTVYLVKGHNSVLAEMVPFLPFFVRSTLLPIYNCWTYDGLVTTNSLVRFRNKTQSQCLSNHVKAAVDNKTVSWRGPSAESGAWSYPPPDFPKIAKQTDKEVVLDWSDIDDKQRKEQVLQEEKIKANVITEECRIIARQIVRTTMDRGGIDYGAIASHNWVFRRFGYSYDENPNGIVTILSAGSPLGMHPFSVDHDRKDIVPTYKVKDVLEAIQQILRTYPQEKLPCCIQADELSVVEPLAELFRECLKEAGQEETVKRRLLILWYPPPSKEESDYATTFGGR